MTFKYSLGQKVTTAYNGQPITEENCGIVVARYLHQKEHKVYEKYQSDKKFPAYYIYFSGRTINKYNNYYESDVSSV